MCPTVMIGDNVMKYVSPTSGVIQPSIVMTTSSGVGIQTIIEPSMKALSKLWLFSKRQSLNRLVIYQAESNPFQSTNDCQGES